MKFIKIFERGFQNRPAFVNVDHIVGVMALKHADRVHDGGTGFVDKYFARVFTSAVDTEGENLCFDTDETVDVIMQKIVEVGR